MRSLLCIVLAAAAALPLHGRPSAPLVLINATLVDGSGGPPIADAVVVARGDRISAAGTRRGVGIPAGGTVIDLGGGTILPGFINAHVHDAYSERNLEAWARAGITTVRDEGIISSRPLAELLALRDRVARDPRYARLVSAGRMIAPPKGYGMLPVASPAQAQAAVEDQIAAGVDLIKCSLEDGYGRRSDLPLLAPASVASIVAAAHRHGRPVSAHVTEAAFLKQAVEAGVDDLGHVAWDPVDDRTIADIVARRIAVTPTLTVLDAYGAGEGAVANLRRFAAAGVRIALGNDYTDVPQNHFPHFELGMPMYEIRRMSDAGMTPAQIIVSATRNAARACRLERTLGTVEAGKIADLLVVSGDPLRDLGALSAVKLVVHAGVVIRNTRR